MKKAIISLVCIMSLGICCGPSHKKLLREATINQAQAEGIALVTVPNGVVKEAELEKEHGLLVWSFDIKTPGAKKCTEVKVDAKTGAIVPCEREKCGKHDKEEHKAAESTK